MNDTIRDILNIIIPVLSGAVGWIAGKRKRDNDALKDMQESIDVLSADNKKLYAELVQLRGDNIALLSNQNSLKGEIAHLRKENEDLRKEIENLNMTLNNVKIIAKKI